ACGFVGNDFKSLAEYSKTFTEALPKQYASWLENSRAFYAAYLKEQLRLAALFDAAGWELPAADSPGATTVLRPVHHYSAVERRMAT
ncbi:MAG: hypothetical protein ACXWH0_13470, partial [Acidimicrobiia bacterium]